MRPVQIHYQEAPSDQYPIIDIHSYPSPLKPFDNIATVMLVESDGKSVTFTNILDRARVGLGEAIAIAEKHAMNHGVEHIYVTKGK